MMRLLKTLGAIIALAGVMIVPPWALLRFIGNPWPAEGVSWSAPITDGAIIGLLAVVVWVLWAQVMACVVAEAIAAVTGDRLQFKVPGTFSVQRQLARRLVTTVVVAVVASPVAAGVASPAISAPAPQSTTATVQVQQESQPATAPGTGKAERTEQAAQQEANHTELVTVMRLDSLWSIAERQLGDGERWLEVAALNEGVTMIDGAIFRADDPIRPGWRLKVPATGATTEASEAAVTVAAGDSLSQIAEDRLGDVEAWPALYAVNETVIGEDPNLIRPGQVLTLPGAENRSPQRGGKSTPGTDARGTAGAKGADSGAAPESQSDPEAGVSAAAGAEQSAAAPSIPRQTSDKTSPELTNPRTDAEVHRAIPRIGSQDTETPVEGVESDAETREESAAESGGVSVLSALLATAACLSAGALGLLVAGRRRQMRARRPGRMVAATPVEVVDVERVVVAHGERSRDDVAFLDLALRMVAASSRAAGTEVPSLGAAVLSADDLTLLFTSPAQGTAPRGWSATDDGRAWILDRSQDLDVAFVEHAAPYPALVGVGRDAHGKTWLLDLESVGRCAIGGTPDRAAALARYLVAELAVNSWSEGSEVLLADDFAGELVGLNPARVRQVQRDEALARADVVADEMVQAEQRLGADVATRRRDGILLDSTGPVVVVVATAPEAGFVDELEQRERSRVLVVHGDAETPVVELDDDGAFLPTWGIRLTPFTLGAEEAEAMAALMASTRSLADEPVPVTSTDEGPLEGSAHADGSLREGFTRPRTAGENEGSLLPEADEVYLTTGATTVEDLAALAPQVPGKVRAEIAVLDPTLDADVAAWFDESSPRPKIHLLGPVSVTSVNGGDPTAITTARTTIGFIAYLACQDQGVTGERAAAACGWKTQRTVQNRASDARFILGTRPDGTDWLPDASMSQGALRGSTPTYELARGIDGILNSADLFVRLRARAQRRGGADGITDLVTALSLVTGAPFEGASESRFRWLYQAGHDRHDQILVGAIHDAAHLVATHAMANNLPDLVQMACETARTASPHSDIAWLDQAAALEAEAGREAADGLVEQVVEQFEEDLPPRTEQVLTQRRWSAAG